MQVHNVLRSWFAATIRYLSKGSWTSKTRALRSGTQISRGTLTDVGLAPPFSDGPLYPWRLRTAAGFAAWSANDNPFKLRSFAVFPRFNPKADKPGKADCIGRPRGRRATCVRSGSSCATASPSVAPP